MFPSLSNKHKNWCKLVEVNTKVSPGKLVVHGLEGKVLNLIGHIDMDH